MSYLSNTPPPKKRSLGQNFLQDRNVSQKIVNSLSIGASDYVLEIGPGAGALSHLIAEQSPQNFILLEKDYYWAEQHGNWAKEYSFKYQPVLIDALTFSWPKLARIDVAWKLVGNLPYNVASPLIWDIVEKTPNWQLAVFMVQKEVGMRMASPSGTREYGALSVWVQSFAKVERLFIVPPGAFDPRPKVDSAVMRLIPVERKLLCRPENLSKLLKICFQQRRKQIKNILKGHWNNNLEKFLDKQELNPENRPETLTPLQFQKLANFMFEDIVLDIDH